MASAQTRNRSEAALVPVSVRPPALYRIPITLTLLGIFLIALQAGQAALGVAAMLTAFVTLAALAVRTVGRRFAPAMILRDQGDRRVALGRYDEARGLYERALAIVQRELPPAAPEVLLNYYSLAAVNSLMLEHARADQYLSRLLDGLDHRVPRAWAGHIAWLLRRVAHYHSVEGRHEHAATLCERALDLVGEAPGADDNTVRSVLDDLGWVHHHAGEYARAEAAFREALSIHEQYRDIVVELAQRRQEGAGQGRSPYRVPSPSRAQTSGGLDRAVAYSLLGLAWTVYERGSYEQARGLFSRASLTAAGAGERLAASAGSGVTDDECRSLCVEVTRGLAAVEMTLGNYDAAQGLYAEAQAALPSTATPTQRAALTIDRAWLARSREEFEDAEQMYADARAAAEADAESGNALVCALHESVAELRRKQGRYAEAHREVQQALMLADRCLGPEHPRRAAILAIASRVYTARSDYGQAERCARQCLRLLKGSLGRKHLRLADGYVALGEVQFGRGQFGASEHAFTAALELRETQLGTEHPELVEILEGRAGVLRATMREAEAGELMSRADRLRVRQGQASES